MTSHDIAATVVWGTCDEATARELRTVWGTALDGPPRDVLLDVSNLTIVDGPAFDLLRRALERWGEDHSRIIQRQAIVSQCDFGSVVIRGYLATFPPPYPVREFATCDTALDWLGHPCCATELSAIADARLDELARLRAWFEHASLEHVTIEIAAAGLAVGPRTLQRRLSAAGTRFASELAHAKIARAQRLMRDPMRKLSEVALEVGCATPSAFSDLYRKMTGESPSRWRRRVC